MFLRRHPPLKSFLCHKQARPSAHHSIRRGSSENHVDLIFEVSIAHWWYVPVCFLTSIFHGGFTLSHVGLPLSLDDTIVQPFSVQSSYSGFASRGTRYAPLPTGPPSTQPRPQVPVIPPSKRAMHRAQRSIDTERIRHAEESWLEHEPPPACQ